MRPRSTSWGQDDKETNLMVALDEKEIDLDEMLGGKNPATSNHSSMPSLQEKFHGSFSSLGSYLRETADHAFDSIKENMEGEIETAPSEGEVRRDNAIKHEKDANVASLAKMSDDEFRRFKEQMKKSKMVTSYAINQQISNNVAKRASMDMNHYSQAS